MQMGGIVGMRASRGSQNGGPSHYFFHFDKGITTEGVGIFPLCKPCHHSSKLVRSSFVPLCATALFLRSQGRRVKGERDNVDHLLLLVVQSPMMKKLTDP